MLFEEMKSVAHEMKRKRGPDTFVRCETRERQTHMYSSLLQRIIYEMRQNPQFIRAMQAAREDDEEAREDTVTPDAQYQGWLPALVYQLMGY